MHRRITHRRIKSYSCNGCKYRGSWLGGDSCHHPHYCYLLHRHGYRGIDARRNLWVLPTGELLYYVAAVAVLFDRDEDAQRHYIGHTEDIMW